MGWEQPLRPARVCGLAWYFGDQSEIKYSIKALASLGHDSRSRFLRVVVASNV
jgi:hypothetical protein